MYPFVNVEKQRVPEGVGQGSRATPGLVSNTADVIPATEEVEPAQRQFHQGQSDSFRAPEDLIFFSILSSRSESRHSF